MGRGRRSGEQRNQATSSHELKKKRRSRTGKGINLRNSSQRPRTEEEGEIENGNSLQPGSTWQGRKLVAGGQRVGTEARRQRCAATWGRRRRRREAARGRADRRRLVAGGRRTRALRRCVGEAEAAA
ncbi:unnamed protein product [Miscanthus lutarioriparius]|uniref:Uncharacterized protein n=1 Tax=Miscanthus lutarioriparius TaxID=422564 RepID=A0A811Q6P0_9POAL|nr:unnamed protein product [Miscanthus lutarioriparius]